MSSRTHILIIDAIDSNDTWKRYQEFLFSLLIAVVSEANSVSIHLYDKIDNGCLPLLEKNAIPKKATHLVILVYGDPYAIDNGTKLSTMRRELESTHVIRVTKIFAEKENFLSALCDHINVSSGPGKFTLEFFDDYPAFKKLHSGRVLNNEAFQRIITKCDSLYKKGPDDLMIFIDKYLWHLHPTTSNQVTSGLQFDDNYIKMFDDPDIFNTIEQKYKNDELQQQFLDIVDRMKENQTELPSGFKMHYLITEYNDQLGKVVHIEPYLSQKEAEKNCPKEPTHVFKDYWSSKHSFVVDSETQVELKNYRTKNNESFEADYKLYSAW